MSGRQFLLDQTITFIRMADRDKTTERTEQTIGQTEPTTKVTIDPTIDLIDQTDEPTSGQIETTAEAKIEHIDQTLEPLKNQNAIVVEPELEEPEFLTIKQLERRYSLQRDALYKRMEHLNIKPLKDGVRSHLNRQQIGYMDELHEYMKQTGKMKDFPRPKPTGPWKEEELQDLLAKQREEETQTLVTEPCEEEAQALVVTTKGSSVPNVNNRQPINIKPASGTYSNAPQSDLAIAKRRSAERAASLIAGEELAVNYFLENPNQLPDDLYQRVAGLKEQLNSSTQRRQEQYDPEYFAQMMLNELSQ